MIGTKKIAVFCILKGVGGYLLLKREKEPHLGKYIPPGGQVNPFEMPIQAIEREVGNLSFQLVGILTETSPVDFNWINYVYTANILESDLSHCREGRLEWISQDQLDPLLLPEVDPFIYEYVAKPQFFVLDAIYDEKIQLIALREEVTGVTLR